MRRHARFLAAIALLDAALSTPADGAGPYPQLRQGWLLGLGMGGGSAGVTDGGSRETGFSGSFRIGYAFNPQVSLEAGSNAWVKSENGTTVTFSFAGPVVSFYPGSGGLALRGGIGVGTVSASTDFGNVTFSSHESGLGLTAGMGYEFRVTRRFALGPQVDFAWSDQSGYRTNHLLGTLGLSWYFLLR